MTPSAFDEWLAANGPSAPILEGVRQERVRAERSCRQRLDQLKRERIDYIVEVNRAIGHYDGQITMLEELLRELLEGEEETGVGEGPEQDAPFGGANGNATEVVSEG
jgi:hypothetical protein